MYLSCEIINCGTEKEIIQSQMLELFEVENLRQKFIQNLEVFIISGQFRNEYIPEEILA